MDAQPATPEAALAANLHFYREHAAEFASRTRTLDLGELYTPFLRLLPRQTHILDAGCGTGRDSAEFLARGYQVTAIDASSAMVDIARLAGVPARVLAFQQIINQEEFDGIWACASLLHVPRGEIDDVLKRFTNALKSRGVIFVTMKEGCGERLGGDGRFFAYYGLEEFSRILSLAGFSLMCASRNVAEDGREWLNFLARKAPPH